MSAAEEAFRKRLALNGYTLGCVVDSTTWLLNMRHDRSCPPTTAPHSEGEHDHSGRSSSHMPRRRDNAAELHSRTSEGNAEPGAGKS